MSTTVRFTALCTHGTRLQHELDRLLAHRRRVAHLMARADEDGDLPVFLRQQSEIAALKARVEDQRKLLNAHVGHCNLGCVRDSRQGLDNSAFENDRAPSHAKPPLPRMAEIAARLRNGEALEAVSAEYDRHPQTLRGKLQHAGFHATTGRPHQPRVPRPTPAPVAPLVDETWRESALCAQTDPEAFFPDQGGSTRSARNVCAACDVATQCLDYALEHNERFGVWGGLTERSRRHLKSQTTPSQEAS